MGDWGLGIGDWGLGPIHSPQSPIPNPQYKYHLLNKVEYLNKIINLIKINIIFKNVSF